MMLAVLLNTILFPIQQNPQTQSFVKPNPNQMASIQSIFKEFDLDGSGFIDVKELKEVAKKLGEIISDNDIKELMRGIDTNRDGKISFEEFKEWWIKGHKGKLNELIVLKSKTLKAYDQVKQKFKQSGLSLKNYKATEEKDSILIQVAFGENKYEINPETSGIKLGVQYGQNQFKKFIETAAMKNPFLDESTVSLTLKFPTEQPKKLQKAIKQAIKEVLDALALNVGIQISLSELQSNEYFQVKMQANEKEKYFMLYIEPGKMVKELIDQMVEPQKNFNQKMGDNFQAQVEFELGINSSIKQMLSSDKNLVQVLMQGCNLLISVNANSSGLKLIKDYVLKQSREPDQMLMFLARKMDLNIKIRTPQKLEEFFKKLGIWDLVSELPTVKDLVDLMAPEIQTLSQKSEAGERDQIPFFTAIRKFIRALATYCLPGVEIVLGKPNMVFFAFIQGEGLKNLYDSIFTK